LTDWSSVSFIFKRFKCKKRRFHRILSTIPALFAQAQPTFETQHLEFRRKGPFIAAFSMGKGDLPLPHFSKQTWVCAFFITSVESFYRDEKIVHSRAYVFFTTVKIRTIESAHFVVQFLSCKNGIFVAKNWALLFPQPM
jgi:rod shape-determining protein rodA